MLSRSGNQPMISERRSRPIRIVNTANQMARSQILPRGSDVKGFGLGVLLQLPDARKCFRGCAGLDGVRKGIGDIFPCNGQLSTSGFVPEYEGVIVDRYRDVKAAQIAEPFDRFIIKALFDFFKSLGRACLTSVSISAGHAS